MRNAQPIPPGKQFSVFLLPWFVVPSVSIRVYLCSYFDGLQVEPAPAVVPSIFLFSVSLWQNHSLIMLRRLNYRLLFVALLIAASATVEIAREYRPSFLRPDLRLYAYVGNSGDGTVSVIDLIRMGNIATIVVGGAPSGLRANPTLKQVWGVSTEGGYA